MRGGLRGYIVPWPEDHNSLRFMFSVKFLKPLKPSGNNCCQRMRFYLFAETIYLTQLLCQKFLAKHFLLSESQFTAN